MKIQIRNAQLQTAEVFLLSMIHKADGDVVVIMPHTDYSKSECPNLDIKSLRVAV